MKSTLVAYILWLPGLLFVCGLHRLYCGKTASGLLWLFTCGLFGVGQVLDLILIPGMVANANLMAFAFGNRNTNTNVNNVVVHVAQPQQPQRRRRIAN